jgi:hypothetical protein
MLIVTDVFKANKIETMIKANEGASIKLSQVPSFSSRFSTCVREEEKGEEEEKF